MSRNVFKGFKMVDVDELRRGKGRDEFLNSVCGFLKSFLRDEKNSSLKCPNERVPWFGQPVSYWPQADIMIESFNQQFIIEIDTDSNPPEVMSKVGNKFWVDWQVGKYRVAFTVNFEKNKAVVVKLAKKKEFYREIQF